MEFWNGKRVLITGISGFVGPYLARTLLERGAEVWGLFRPRADGRVPARVREMGLEGEVRLVVGDLRDLASLASALDEARPEVVFHLAAQSFVARSFRYPVETFEINTLGTANLLEAVRFKNPDIRVVFAGSSEEYGLVFHNETQLARAREKYGRIFPEPTRLPELPIREENPLRPMSPYAVSKVQGDYMMRNYFHSYRIPTIVSRAFNHEGAGRGPMFVTSQIANQVMRRVMGEQEEIRLGYVGAFRDWSHIQDVVEGYVAMAEKGEPGEVYNLGSARTNSVLTYLLWALEEVDWKVHELRTLRGDVRVEDPGREEMLERFGVAFAASRVDRMLLDGEVDFTLEQEGLRLVTEKGEVVVRFDPSRFRPAEVPILLTDARKARERLGWVPRKGLRDILRDQINFYLDPHRRFPPE